MNYYSFFALGTMFILGVVAGLLLATSPRRRQ